MMIPPGAPTAPGGAPPDRGTATQFRSAALFLPLIVLLPAFNIGCITAPSSLRRPERMEQGYVIVLPGVEGESYWNANIAKGLNEGGVHAAIEVYDWVPLGAALVAPLTMTMENRNRSEARKVARKIMDYQDNHPGRPVHLIGHSGGGGIAVYVLEALPMNRKINSAILLAPAISPTYNLIRAMKRTEAGIWNYWSPQDVGFLRGGTTLVGTIDREHTSAAGAVGFQMPWGLDQEGRQFYADKLHQQRYNRQMADSGHRGGHFGWAGRSFVRDWLAPVILSQNQGRVQTAVDTPPAGVGAPPTPNSDPGGPGPVE